MNITPEIETALLAGAAIAISVSGGKDSDCMTYDLHRRKFEPEI